MTTTDPEPTVTIPVGVLLSLADRAITLDTVTIPDDQIGDHLDRQLLNDATTAIDAVTNEAPEFLDAWLEHDRSPGGIALLRTLTGRAGYAQGEAP